MGVPARADDVSRAFAARFGRQPTVIVRSPGRVNLIGDHTDYNDGFALPIAVDLRLDVAAAARADGVVEVVSTSEERPVVVGQERTPASRWARYVEGAVEVLRAEGVPVTGADVLVTGDLPPGRGLSSSAALILGLLVALCELGGVAVGRARLARLGQRVEQDHADVRCGLMDFLAILSGQPGSAVFIDCRTDEVEPVAFPADGVILVLDTGTPRSLHASAYNDRRRDCELAVAALHRRLPAVDALRDVTLDDLAAHADLLTPVHGRRARHVVTENARVLAARAALHRGDLPALGALLRESQDSLRDDYEVSTDALDAVVAIASKTPAVYGARLTGAGFGGCAVAVADGERAAAAAATIRQRYAEATRRDLIVHLTRPGAGLVVLPRPSAVTRSR